MSTRSGKRIHNSFHDSILKPDLERVVESERKTRSRRLKENDDEFSISIMKNKKRNNYVSYPSDDDVGVIDTVDSKEEVAKPTRLLRKNALKEQNLVTSSTGSAESTADVKKAVRTTRRTRKFPDDTQENIKENQNHIEEELNIGEIEKSKKGKKKKQHDTEQVIEEIVISKKKAKKKKRSGSMIVEDIEPQNGKKNSLNKSNMSVDSFHSAAGSPQNALKNNSVFDIGVSPQKDSEIVNIFYEENDVAEKHTEKQEGRRTRSTTRLSGNIISMKAPNKIVNESRKRKSSTKDLNKSIASIVKETELEEPLSNTFTNVAKKRKSSFMDIVSNDIKNSTYDIEDLEKMESINATFDLESSKKNTSNKSTVSDILESSSVLSTTNGKVDITETTKSTVTNSLVDKSGLSGTKRMTRQSVLNTTFDKSVNNSPISADIDSIAQKHPLINTTFEKDSDTDTKQEQSTRKSSIKNTTFEKNNLPSEIHSKTPNDNRIPKKLKTSMSSDKLSTEMNSTFDKAENLHFTFNQDKKLDATFDNSSKSSLVSSGSSNITMDKSDLSRISITSDESKENIVNMTPVLIESSLDESQINVSKVSPKSPAQAPLTPLKREGTFTKESSEVVESENLKLSKTPTKRMSLPSPGCTPFHTDKIVSKEKSVLNVTRSIEKSRRSSLAEPLMRATKVMFCSPVNNPAVVLQQRRKVIKSNLKGSNKSFVFEETASMETRPAPRKRSYTQSDADDARVKRKRLAEGLQHSVDRLSRPRTSSASAKLAEPSTPSKKPVTPKKSEAKIWRTKLPNFAVLHQKEFDKMESLNECQERKAKRAKQLLTPTGAVTVLERSSPRDNATEQKSPDEPTEELKVQDNEKKEPKKQETPVKSLPTLKSLNPGYTRFGFKLNLDANPFSIPSKSDFKNDKIFSFTTKKESKAKARLFSFSSKKDNTKRDNTKPLKEIKTNLTGQAILPSLAGTTSLRREIAKQTIMREKSFTDKRNIVRNENRTVIKGVRTNRRFELQMRMRNIEQ